jgi:Methylase involved in ubiquinone/menaquinone biosynthesis
MDSKYNPQVSIEHYKKQAFLPMRIESITEQLRQICYSGYTNILEIGVGIGFLRHCTRLFPQISITTLDISEDLHPDYLGSVTDMPFEDKQFELVVCCEVLEHLPFADFLPALKEIRRVARHKAIISLPDRRRRYFLTARLPWLGWLNFAWNPARGKLAREKFEFNGEHYWEIGYKGTNTKDVVRKIKDAGFKIEKQYRLLKHDYHCFFILRSC